VISEFCLSTIIKASYQITFKKNIKKTCLIYLPYIFEKVAQNYNHGASLVSLIENVCISSFLAEIEKELDRATSSDRRQGNRGR